MKRSSTENLPSGRAGGSRRRRLVLEYSFSGEMERGTAIGVLVTVFVLIVTLVVRALGFRLARERA